MSHHDPTPIDAPLVSKPGILDHASANLRTAFLDCFLVPVPRATDLAGFAVPAATEAATPAFQSKLTVSNVGVVMGCRSAGLLAMTFSHRAGLDAFLERNPASSNSLVTEHAGEPVLWHKADTNYRLSHDLPGCHVQMTGVRIVFRRDDIRRPDMFLARAVPTQVSLESVDWGDDPHGAVAAWLTSLRHGDFFRRGCRGQIIPITRTWRAYLAARLAPTVVFDIRDRQFYRCVSPGNWEPVADHQMRDELRRLIQDSPIGSAEAKARFNDERLARLCTRLKSSLAAHTPIVEARVSMFLQQHLTKEPGANVTNQELAQVFAGDCHQTGQPPLSPKQFRALVGLILRKDPWTLCYSKSIRRAPGEQNGWRGVRLR